MNHKYKKFIKKGSSQPLQSILFHNKAKFIKRIIFGKNSFFGSNYHIAVHIINNLPKKIPKYVEPHTHNCDEINILLSEKGKLVYKIKMNDESYIVSSPSIVCIPKGIKHTAEVVRGHGIFVVLIGKSYKDSLVINKKTKR
jgi:cupin superfamily acireductone dioxygenase involved in methionine salvage